MCLDAAHRWKVTHKRDPHQSKETHKRDLYQSKETHKRDLGDKYGLMQLTGETWPIKETHINQKRPTKETHINKKRPTKETYINQKRPTKETHKRDPQKRPISIWGTCVSHIDTGLFRLMWHRLSVVGLFWKESYITQKRPTKDAYINQKRRISIKRDVRDTCVSMQLIREKRATSIKRDPQKRPTATKRDVQDTRVSRIDIRLFRLMWHHLSVVGLFWKETHERDSYPSKETYINQKRHVSIKRDPHRKIYWYRSISTQVSRPSHMQHHFISFLQVSFD